MRAPFTVAIWTVSLLCLLVGGLIATIVIAIPFSLDPSEMISAGIEPWRDAAVVAGGFLALLVVSGLGLGLWHSARFKPVALLLTFGEVVAVIWSGVIVYNDYF